MKLNNNYFILRHGEALSNKKRFVSSWPEKIYNPLTEKGKKQVKKIIPGFKKEKIDLIFSSDLLRAKQTAEKIAKELKLKVNFDKRLREIGMGVFNGNSEDDWNRFYKTNAERFTKRPQGGENYRDVRKRAVDFIKEIDKKYKNKKILITSHGCTLFSMQAGLKNLTEEEEISQRKNLILKTGELRKIC